MAEDRSTLSSTAGSTPQSLDPTPQKVGGRYEILGLMGAGGMGTVYRARDVELDELIALKMLQKDFADNAQIVARFRQEVKLARKVTHKNVARTFDLGEDGGDRFLTMELIEGESLASIMSREGRLPLGRVMDFVSPICEGLTAAHAAGVVHRDLKPENVLVGADGRVVIMDFGIARATVDAKKTVGAPVGTPAYMAPEQVEASPDVDARADIYALGVMMFEMVTGHLPFPGESVYAIAAARLLKPPPDPRGVRPDVPEQVATLIMKCMARKPEERVASASDVAQRLAAVTLPATGISQPSLPPSRVHAPTDTQGGDKTVAVLPFRNGGPAEDDYLVDGLTDDLIDALSMTPGLRVRPRGVVMNLKGTTRDPRDVGRELDVHVVVEGTLRTAGDTIRVNARVLSVADGFQLWAKRFDGTRADVLKIGDQVASAISEALTVKLNQARHALTDPITIDLYLRGRHELLKFWGDANDRAIVYFEKAVQRAPTDPLILSSFAIALAREFGINAPNPTRARAREIAEQAVSVGAHIPDAHVALAAAALQEADVVNAARSVRKALSLSSQTADAWDLGARLLLELDEPERTIEWCERAIALEPRFRHLRYVKARVDALQGNWDEVASGLSTAPIEPEENNAYWLTRVRLAAWKGSVEMANAIMTEIATMPSFQFAGLVTGMAGIIANRTLPDIMRKMLEERAGAPASRRGRSFLRQIQAEILAQVDDHEGMLVAIEQSVTDGLFDITWMDRCPTLQPLRAMPRFLAARSEVAARALAARTELLG